MQPWASWLWSSIFPPGSQGHFKLFCYYMVNSEHFLGSLHLFVPKGTDVCGKDMGGGLASHTCREASQQGAPSGLGGGGR